MLIFGITLCVLGTADIVASLASVNRPNRSRHIATGSFTVLVGLILCFA